MRLCEPDWHIQIPFLAAPGRAQSFIHTHHRSRCVKAANLDLSNQPICLWIIHGTVYLTWALPQFLTHKIMRCNKLKMGFKYLLLLESFYISTAFLSISRIYNGGNLIWLPVINRTEFLHLYPTIFQQLWHPLNFRITKMLNNSQKTKQNRIKDETLLKYRLLRGAFPD